MRTTLDLDDELVLRAKIRAVEERTTLTAVIERGLRSVLDSPGHPRRRVSVPTWQGPCMPGDVDWNSNAAVLAWLDGTESADAI